MHHFVHFYKIMVLEGKYIPSPYDSAWLWRYIRFKRSRCKVNVRAVWQAREVKETKVHSKDFWMCGFPLVCRTLIKCLCCERATAPTSLFAKQILITGVWETRYAHAHSVRACECLHAVQTLGEATTMAPLGPSSVSSNVPVNQCKLRLDAVE